jgi:uncharacterized protein (TIGR03000 family)
MYSMVLMAALTAAPDTAGFGRGCFGCGGCTGAVVSVGCTGCTGPVMPLSGSCNGCFGSCFGSCYGSGCGGGCHSIFPLFPRLRSRLAGVFGGGCYSSCHGSCHGSACYGSACYSSCHGAGCYSASCVGMTFGATAVNPINPTTACYGSPIFYNRTGTLSGPTVFGWPVYSPTSFGYGSCFGSGGPVFYGPDFHQGGSYAPPVIGSGIVETGLGSTAPAVPTITIDNTKEFRSAERAPAAAPARLTVELPTSAKLYVDGTLVKGDTASRNFHTPDLPGGKTFYYDLKAEVEVNGKTVTEEKRVLVKAGDARSESFDKLIAAVKKDGDKAVAAK